MSRTNIVYIRNSGSTVWHWKKECSLYPVSEHIEAMVFTGIIPAIELCPECISMDVVYRAASLTLENSFKRKEDLITVTQHTFGSESST